jgi:hypothetical protein
LVKKKGFATLNTKKWGIRIMQTTRQPSCFRTLTFITLFCLLVAPLLANAAEKPKKAVAVKQTTKQTTKRTNRSSPRAKAITQEAPQVTEETARASFDVFTQEWMNKMVEAEEFQRTKRVQVSETPEGFSAEYIGYLPQRTIEVKKTEYTDTPFVGTLMYQERTMRCLGKSKEEALRGPFQQVKTSPVREIFRFTKGKWEY